MNASETIQAAIDKLEEAVALSNLAQAVDDPSTLVVDCGQWVGEMMTPRMAADVVTLHRTIDAQLAVLREARSMAAALTKNRIIVEESWKEQPEFALAAAILGEVR